VENNQRCGGCWRKVLIVGISVCLISLFAGVLGEIYLRLSKPYDEISVAELIVINTCRKKGFTAAREETLLHIDVRGWQDGGDRDYQNGNRLPHIAALVQRDGNSAKMEPDDPSRDHR
jgi:hypothetical protein